jgi:hypothetical protein
LVLAESSDAAAAWVAAGLQRRGFHPVELVTADQLGSAVRWEHRLGDGPPLVRITLADGRQICSAEVRGTVSRLFQVPPAAVARLEPDDRAYGQGELFALYTSWLHALPGNILGAPEPLGLCGRWRPATEWAALAARAGLTVAPVQIGDASPAPEPGPMPPRPDTAIVVAGRVVGRPLPDDVRACCSRLAALAGTELLGIALDRGNGTWRFAGATAWPDLLAGGEPLLDAVADAMRKPAR